RLVEVVEDAALGVERMLGRIEVLGGAGVRCERPAAEGDGAGALVMDREDQPVAEAVIKIGPCQLGRSGGCGLVAAALGGLAAELAKSGAHGELGRETMLLQPLRKPAAVLGGIAQVKLAGERRRDAAGLQIRPGLDPLAPGQGAFEVFA